VTLVGVGAITPEVVAAAGELTAAGRPADVICLTSPDLVFRALQARQGLGEGDDAILDELFPVERATPLVTVLDGHPHTLSFVSAIRCMPIASLGVSDFGQSGDVDDLYRHFGLDVDTIVGAALDLLP
jgi:pyruvate dehydrogenase E1 component